jgi:signal transduction histidine kinase
LFWKFFLSILLAQLAATVGIGGAVWLKNRSQVNSATADLDTSPPAEMAINAAASTLTWGGPMGLKSMLVNMERHRVFAVDELGHELLGRIVSPAMLLEAHHLLKQDNKRPVVRQVAANDGHRYLLFLPSRARLGGFDGERRSLLPGLGEDSMAALDMRRAGVGYFDFAKGPGGPRPPGGADAAHGQGSQAGQAGPGGAVGPGDPGGPGGPGDARGPGGPERGGGPGGPRFQPLTPWVPIAAATMASLLFAGLLAWYFSRPIRALRLAFEAAAGGDLAPRFSQTAGKRGSELNDLGRDFDRMTARLRSLIDGQTRLLHDVSHELRSPLARLQAAIGLAHQQPDKIQASLERIERESVRMDKLVGELLTLSRLEAGAINAAQEEISMAELLQQIVDDARYEAASQGRSVALHDDDDAATDAGTEGNADAVVIGQADLLARAIENVVRNAIKHSPDGGAVQLEMAVLAPGPGARQMRIRVLDDGRGVAPEDLASIFQPFFRSSSASTEGHGLGLAIAQHVVQAHGGSIKAANRASGGLCVEILLPLAARRTEN